MLRKNTFELPNSHVGVKINVELASIYFPSDRNPNIEVLFISKRCSHNGSVRSHFTDSHTLTEFEETHDHFANKSK